MVEKNNSKSFSTTFYCHFAMQFYYAFKYNALLLQSTTLKKTECHCSWTYFDIDKKSIECCDVRLPHRNEE